MEKSKVKGRKKRKIEVSIGNMVKLSQELESLLRMSVPIKSRYYLTKLSWVSNEHANRYSAANNELVSKFGVLDQKTKNLTIPPTIKTVVDEVETEEVNPSYIEYQRGINNVLSEKVTIEFDEIYLDDLGARETDVNFPALFMLI